MASFYGGIPGESMIISKRYESKTEMNNNIDDIRVGEYVVISLEDDDNDSSGIGNIYKKNYSGELQFIGNFKGANGTHPKLQYNENLREGSEGETGANIADGKISVPLEAPNENESIQLLYKNDIANGIVFIKFLSFPNPAMKLNFNDSTGLFNFISSSSNATTNVKISSNKPLIENIQVYNVNKDENEMIQYENNIIEIKSNDNSIKVDSSTIPSFESIENFTNDTLILYKYTNSDVWECLTSFSEMIGNNNTTSNSTTNSLDNYIEDIRFNNETGQLLIYNPNISIDFDNQNNPYNKNEGDFYKYDGYFNAVSGTGHKYYGVINLKSYIQQVISDMKEYINYKFDCNDAQIDVRLRFILNENKIDQIAASIEISSLTSSEENTVSFKNPNPYTSIDNATLTYLESDENNFINKIKTYFQEEGNTQENTKYFKIDGQYYQITSDFAEKIRKYIMKFFDSNERKKFFIRYLSSGYFLLYSLSPSVVDISSSGTELPQGISSDSDERILTVSGGQREHVVRFSNSNDDTSNNLFKNGLYLNFKTSAIDNNGRGLLS